MFTDALGYPRDGTDAAKTILVGTLLTLLGVLLVPLVLVTGYTVRVVRAVHDGDAHPPAFAVVDDWRPLLVDGVKALVVTVAYFLPAGLVLAATAVAATLLADGTTTGGYLSGTVGLLGVLLAGVVGLACYYAAAAGFVTVARTGSVRAAFVPGTVLALLRSRRFANAWALSVVVLVLTGVLGLVFGLLPLVVDAVLSALASFYAAVAVAYLLARGSDVETGVAEPSGEGPVDARTPA